MAKLLDKTGWKKIDWLLIANIVALVLVGLMKGANQVTREMLGL